MASKKKLLTSAIALGTAAALTLGGTFAWQSISQKALNEASDIVNPGGRLHNDQHWVSAKVNDNNIYVENFTDPDNGGNDIYARVRLSEYMEVVVNYGTKAEVVETIVGSKEAADADSGLSAVNASQQDAFTYTYEIHDFTKDFDGDDDTKNPTGEFFTWATGKTTEDSEAVYYMPTFNKNKDSVAADLNGLYADTLGGISNRSQDQYVEYTDWAEADTMEGNAIYDGDSNTDDELKGLDYTDLMDLIDGSYAKESSPAAAAIENGNIMLAKETHTAAKVGTTRGLIALSDWLALEEDTDNYWVYDDSADGNGWVYWSSPIKAGTTTGLLLDGFTLNEVMDDTWYYAIEVEGQFVTANDVGKDDSTGFYADGEAPSYKAEKLLEAIGVDLEVSPKALTISEPKLTDRADGGLTITAKVEVNNEPAADTGVETVKGYLGEDKDDVTAIVGTITNGTVTFSTDGHQFWQGRDEQYYLHTTLDFAIGYTDEDGDALTSNTVNLKYAEELKLGSDGTGTITLTEDGLKRFAVTTSDGNVTPNITVSTADGSELTKDTDFEYDMFAGRLVIKGDSYVGQTLTVAEYIEPKAISVNFTHDGQNANYATDFKVGVEDTLSVSFTNKWGQEIVDEEDVAAIMANADFTLKTEDGITLQKDADYAWTWSVDGSDVKITIDQDYIDDLTLSYSIPGYDGYGSEYTHKGDITLTPDFTDVYGAKEVNFLKLGMDGHVYDSAEVATATANLNEDYWIYCDENGYGTRWMETKSEWFADGVITSSQATVQYSADDPGNQIGVSGTTVTFAEGTGACNGETVCTQERTDTRCQKITFTKEGYFILKFRVGSDRGDNFTVVVEVN